MTRRRIARLVATGLTALVAGTWRAPAAAAGLTLQITPGVQTVTPGAEFEVKLRVVGASDSFNAFHAVVVYDPLALTPVPLSPLKSQVDSLFSRACANNVNWFHVGAFADTIDVSMLCAGVRTAGPGPVYRLRFRASATPQQTGLRLEPDLEFADAGVVVPGVVALGAAIGIGVTPVLDAGPGASPAAAMLTASPNPAPGDVRLDFGRPLSAAAVLAVHDVQGRLLMRRALAAGERAAVWDGRDLSGAPAAPGHYLASLRSGATLRLAHITRVR